MAEGIEGEPRPREEPRPEGRAPEPTPAGREAPPVPADSDEPATQAEPGHATEELLRELKRGDEEAYRRFDRRYRDLFRSAFHGRLPADLRSRLDTEDVVQSGLHRAYLQIESFEYRGKDSLRAWLATILENRLRSQVRRNRQDRRDHRLEEPRSEEALRGAATDGDPESALVAMRLAEVATHFYELPEEHRAVLSLVVEQRLSSEEVARELGLSPRTARRRVRDALDALARSLEA